MLSHNANYMQACDHITYVHNKYFNWFALNVIQHFNTRARVLKRTRGVILLSNIIFNSLQGLLVYYALPSVLDPVVMECSEFRAFF